MSKKARCVKGLGAEAPAGYHYEGQPAQMIDGKLTVRLRRDVEVARNEIYKDLYYAVTELGETCTIKSAKFICCIAACKKKHSYVCKKWIYCIREFF